MREKTEKNGMRFAALGAAFLLAASAVGPGFLIQTTRFSAEGGQPFFYAVLLVTLADIVTKANIWSVVGAAGLTGAQIADRVQKGLGTVLTVAVVIGGLAFNTGNIGGAALGLSAVSGVPERVGVLVCATLAAGVFCFRGAKRITDVLAVVFGGIIVCAVFAVCVKTQPPVLSTVRALPQPNAALSTSRTDFGITIVEKCLSTKAPVFMRTTFFPPSVSGITTVSSSAVYSVTATPPFTLSYLK